MASNPQGVERLLGIPELAWLLQCLRNRFERGGDVTGRLALPKVSSSEQEALNRLLGRRLATGAKSLALAELESVILRSGISSSLREAVEALSGPCFNRPEERRQENARWAALFTETAARLGERTELRAWLAEVERSGLLRRYTDGEERRGRELLTGALEVILSLPAQEVALAEFAALKTGNSHALDAGTELGSLVLRAVALISGLPKDWVDSEGRRALWESVGVFCDELSSSVLVLNLRADADSLCGRTLLSHAEAGEPCRLTLREILRHPPVFGDRYAAKLISICENPTVLAGVADRLGVRSAPLICIEGKPRTIAARLLRLLVESGALLRYHGDFDWEGVRIANFVIKRFGAQPWRMSAQDYEEASSQKPGKGGDLSGEPVAAEWDSFLVSRMLAASKSVHEEALIEVLSRDLSTAGLTIVERI